MRKFEKSDMNHATYNVQLYWNMAILCNIRHKWTDYLYDEASSVPYPAYYLIILGTEWYQEVLTLLLKPRIAFILCFSLV